MSRSRTLIWLGVLSLLAILASGQTALAQGINPLPLIIQNESGGNPTAQNPNTTSSGLAGDINSTWAQALALCGCGATAQFPSAASAPASVQIAANNALINAQGLQPWLCPGCDPAFATQVAAAGGPGAFQTSGLDTNPANFANADTPSGLQTFLGDAGGTATFGDGTTLAAGTPLAAGGAASPSSLPFQWIFAQVITNIFGQIEATIQTVENIAAGQGSILLALAVAVMGVLALLGEVDTGYFMGFLIRAVMVVAFIQVGNSYYHDWVEMLIVGLPGYFANAFSLTGNGNNPAQLFDAILNGWMASSLATWHSAGWSLHAIWVLVSLGLLTVFIVLPSLVAMFTVFLISTFLLLVMLTIGPLMILAVLFKATYRFFHGYVNVMVTGVIFALVVDIVLGIFSSILTQIMAQFTPSGSPDTDLPGLFGLAVTMLITGFSMGRLPRLVESIGGAVAVNMDRVGNAMAGGWAVSGASAGAALATRAL